MASPMHKVSSLTSAKLGDTLTNIQNWGNVFYNVQNYGIYADGTDYTNQLQALVNLANSEGRTAIFFPAGEYYIRHINNDENIYYFGDNAKFVGGYEREIVQIGSPPRSDLVFNVKEFGAKGDGITNDTTAIQKAINAASIVGGVVYFPAGVYRARNLDAKSNVTMIASFGSVTLKLPDGVDGQLLGTMGQMSGVVIKNFGIEGIIFDGNKVNSAKVTASSAVAINNCEYVTIRNCVFRNATGYGLAFQAFPGGPINGNQKNLYVENCYFLDNGDGVGGDTHDGLDIKYCEDSVFIKCFASGNVDKGLNIRGVRVTVDSCVSISNGADGFLFQGNHTVTSLLTEMTVSNCYAENNGDSGFYIADGSATATQFTKVNMSNIVAKNNGVYGINIDPGSNKVYAKISNAEIYGNVNHGILVRVPAAGVIISNSSIYGNGGSGIFTGSAKTQISDCQINSNSRYGIEETGTRTVVSGATYVQGNTLGNFLFASNKRYMIGRGVIDYDIGSADGDIIASATTLNLPEGGDAFFITGSTAISTITASRRGRQIMLNFTSSVTINHGTGNIRLNGGNNINALNRHVLTLLCDGSIWYQVSYSANA
ncbi:glycosyl hydrolase family 28-related protein [Paenibacillus provencensis]|uniref:Glycosyl hydrolase family 28-related protein n=1 Tax=Paenibacillus provencensis TaxID=441151 RepID=A0ABW3PMW8_9BACL|nr:right-handed parallel beta-helix repeat-containing protein [Paenibacillus sp. MER 78]MCM3130943.1 right-handed parallel beta-helix repeat-containing protein [Paenibacillus sp. MER 78]